MRRNVILLDIDDCIYPNDNNWFGKTDDSLKMLKINCKRLKKICKSFNLSIIIISSMSVHIKKVKGNFVHEYSLKKSNYNKNEQKAVKIINKYLKKYIEEITDTNKEISIKRAIQDKSIDKAIIIDDTDFSYLVNPNNGSHYIPVKGFISGNVGYKIMNIVGLWDDNKKEIKSSHCEINKKNVKRT